MSISQAQLDMIFPAARTDAFFEALFGGAEEGAYDIRLECDKEAATRVDCVFALRKRPGKCLRCQLTSGLPHVFERHPVLDVAGVAKAVAEIKGWNPDMVKWSVGDTLQLSEALHKIPLTIVNGEAKA